MANKVRSEKFRKVFNLYGIYGNYSFLKMCHFCLVIFIALLCIYSYGCGVVFNEFSSLGNRCITIICTLQSFGGLLKLGYLKWYSEEFSFLLNTLEDYGHETKFGKLAKKTIVTYIITLTVMSIFCIFEPLISGSTQTPFSVKFPGLDRTLQGAVIEYLAAAFLVTFQPNIHAWFECYTVLFSSQISDKIEVLQESLKTIGELRTNQRLIYDKDPIENLHKCAQEHTLILRLIKYYEKIVSFVFFIQTTISVLAIGLCLFTVLTADEDSKYRELFFSSPLIFAQYTQIFLYCWSGENIQSAIEALGFSAYSMNWLERDINFRKTLFLIQTNLTKDFFIMGFSVVKMSLGTFVTCVQQSYSIFMVAKAYTNKK